MVYHLQVKTVTAGTPVFLASVQTKADWIQVTPIIGNTGAVYLGGSNQTCGNGTSGTYGIKLTTSGSEAGAWKGFFYPVISVVRSPYDLSKIPLNSDVNAEGVNVYYGRG